MYLNETLLTEKTEFGLHFLDENLQLISLNVDSDVWHDQLIFVIETTHYLLQGWMSYLRKCLAEVFSLGLNFCLIRVEDF